MVTNRREDPTYRPSVRPAGSTSRPREPPPVRTVNCYWFAEGANNEGTYVDWEANVFRGIVYVLPAWVEWKRGQEQVQVYVVGNIVPTYLLQYDYNPAYPEYTGRMLNLLNVYAVEIPTDEESRLTRGFLEWSKPPSLKRSAEATAVVVNELRTPKLKAWKHLPRNQDLVQRFPVAAHWRGADPEVE